MRPNDNQGGDGGFGAGGPDGSPGVGPGQHPSADAGLAASSQLASSQLASSQLASSQLGASQLGSGEGRRETLPRQFGKYLLMRKLAAGGMAELFLALHRAVAGFEKIVVIKRILPQMNNDRQFIDMLLHEARIAATLSHPNIVQTFDVGLVDGTYFIAMEHIHGEDIRSIVRQMKKKEVMEFPLEHALSVVIGLCSGLAYAHEKRDLEGKLLGIVHRDISPQNIVLTFSGDVKVVDFGVAKSLHATEDTRGSSLKGKVPYMSPEQANAEDIDWRSDIFAAGVILFELTTGKRLFKGASEYDTLKLICETDYPTPSEIVSSYPPALERIVMKALAKSREARYQSARELQADLEAFVRQERLVVSAVTLSEWMRSLFAEKLDEQKAELQDIKQLADRLSADFPQSSGQDFAPASTGSHPRAFDHSTTAAGAPPAAHSIPPGKKGRGGVVIAGVAIAAIGIAGAAYFATRNTNPSASTTTTAEPSSSGPATSVATVDKRAKVTIDSDPTGAAIWIDGELFDKPTPATIDMPSGREIKLKISKEGYASYKETFTLSAAEARTIKPKLTEGGVTVTLDITPEPTVWIDNQQWTENWKTITGLTPDEEHTIVVTAPGFQPKTFTFKAKQGETKSFKHALVKLTPEQIAALNNRTSSTSTAPSATAPAASTTTAAPSATPSGTGTVRVNSKNGFCTVSVNGAAVGVTPVSTSVPAGKVRVSCKPESGAAKASAFEIKPGETKRITFEL